MSTKVVANKMVLREVEKQVVRASVSDSTGNCSAYFNGDGVFIATATTLFVS